MGKRILTKEDAINEMQDHYDIMDDLIVSLIASWAIDMESEKRDKLMMLRGKIDMLKKQQIEII